MHAARSSSTSNTTRTVSAKKIAAGIAFAALVAVVSVADRVAADFTTCAAWGSTCTSIIRPNTCLNPAGVCYNPQPNFVCASCVCTGGDDKGKTAGVSVVMGFDAATCNQFFATNSTPTSINTAPVLTSSGASASGTASAAGGTGTTTSKSAAVGSAVGGVAAIAAAVLVGAVAAVAVF